MQQNNGQVEGSVYDIGSIVHIVKAVSHLAAQISSQMQKAKIELPADVEEAAKVLDAKHSEVEATVKMLSVAVAGIQFIHMILVNVARNTPMK